MIFGTKNQYLTSVCSQNTVRNFTKTMQSQLQLKGGQNHNEMEKSQKDQHLWTVDSGSHWSEDIVVI